MKNIIENDEYENLCDLAACYHLCHRYGFTDRINTHISSRSNINNNNFYLNPVGLLFDEVKASNLVCVSMDGEKIDKDNKFDFNDAGYLIHSAVLSTRNDVNCIIHHHSIAGMVVGALEEGLMFVNQHSLQFYNKVAYHVYEGFGRDIEKEKDRLASDLYNNDILFMRNHGVLVCGKTVGEAFCRMDDLEKACKTQIDLLSTKRKIHIPSDGIAKFTKKQFDKLGRPAGETEWPAMRRLLDRLNIDYKS